MAVSDAESTNEWPGAEGTARAEARADALTGAQADARTGTRPDPRAGAQGSVLVVDDDPTVSEVVAGYLERAGFSVRLAADGPTGLRAAEEHRPDLLVLDLMLPGMDGLEVCRRLRAGENGGRPVPVIMLTARGDEDDRILGLEVGADDYVTKPFSPRELVLRVRSV
ncbi:response regulator transcription factor, partial [Streptomyces nojiriensis]